METEGGVLREIRKRNMKGGGGEEEKYTKKNIYPNPSPLNLSNRPIQRLFFEFFFSPFP